MTYRELGELSSQVAAAITELGPPPGSRVGLSGPNSPFWVAAYLAITGLGLVAVPFPVTFTPQETERAAEWVGLRWMVSERALDGCPVPNITRSDLPARRGAIDDGGLHPTADAALMFTSGSMGRPRAVRVTHRNIVANTDSIIDYLRLASDDRILVVLPFSYCFGLSLLHTHLRVGGSVVLQNSLTYPELAVESIANAGCTGFAGVPSTFRLLLRASSFGQRPLPALRKIQQAGGRLPDDLTRAVVAAQPSAELYVMYGQTEATARLSYLPPEFLRSKAGSVGRGIRGVELVVRSPSGQPVAPEEVGQICARGDNISPGYFQDPEATAERFVNGELRTGDLATIDDEGFIYIVGRAADFIKSWGYRFSSQEVERAVLSLTGVVEAAAVGVPDPKAGERVELFVVVEPGSGIRGSDVMARCRQALARHMVPTGVHLLPELPLNANGKVSKTSLRLLLSEGPEVDSTVQPSGRGPRRNS